MRLSSKYTLTLFLSLLALALPSISYATVAPLIPALYCAEYTLLGSFLQQYLPGLTAGLTLAFPIYSFAFFGRAIYVFFRYRKFDGSLILVAFPALCLIFGVAFVALAQSSRAIDRLIGSDDKAIVISALSVFLSPLIPLIYGLRLKSRSDVRWKMLAGMSLVNIAVIGAVVAAYLIPQLGRGALCVQRDTNQTYMVPTGL